MNVDAHPLVSASSWFSRFQNDSYGRTAPGVTNLSQNDVYYTRVTMLFLLVLELMPSAMEFDLLGFVAPMTRWAEMGTITYIMFSLWAQRF